MIKPLLDGIISAFHAHDQTPDGDLISRLHDAGLGDRSALLNELTDRRWAALGSRRLVWPFREHGIQWNPADDYCIAAEIVVGNPGTGGAGEVDAELCTADRKSPSIPND